MPYFPLSNFLALSQLYLQIVVAKETTTNHSNGLLFLKTKQKLLVFH